MYKTIVAILQFFIKFNIRPIEQESGLEKGLNDLLCESFYAGMVTGIREGFATY